MLSANPLTLVFSVLIDIAVNTRTFSDQQHTGFHRGKTLTAFRAYATPTDGMTVIANARINDFGVGVLAKRTMHAPQNNVYGRKNHAARVSFTQPEQ